eukprot:1155718-Pelagomonas_calceolata.AAC.3
MRPPGRNRPGRASCCEVCCSSGTATHCGRREEKDMGDPGKGVQLVQGWAVLQWGSTADPLLLQLGMEERAKGEGRANLRVHGCVHQWNPGRPLPLGPVSLSGSQPSRNSS